MNDAQKTALAASIPHWEDIVANPAKYMHYRDEPPSIFGNSCPLCKAFPDCMGCIIAETKETTECDGTPWHMVYKALQRQDTIDFVANAKTELAFLKQLLQDNPPENPDWMTK